MERTIEALSQHQPVATFDNASMWHNFTLWTTSHLGVNMSRYAPSLEDFVLAGPRMVMKLGKLGSILSFPEAIDGFGQHVIPDATGSDLFSSTSAAAAAGMSGNFITNTNAAAAAVPSDLADQDPTLSVYRFSMEGAKGLGSVFSYATSKWALCCIAMAVVLNRTHIFAATRRRLRLNWPIRLLIRLAPIILFYIQARSILQSIQCQTSPDFAELRWGNASKSSDLMFSQQNRLLHGLSSSLLFGATDEESCLAVQMIPAGVDESSELRGSLSLLWPLFGTFCLSQFLETVSCAVQGRAVSAETGMTLFEHSLAFAEADAAISNQLGWGLFSSGASNASSKASLGSTVAISRSMIMRRVNTPPEVLLIAFLSTMSHLTSHVLGVFGKQAKFRLISTGFWASCFMGSIVWSAITFSLEDSARQGLLRYPTVCIIGFIPHVLVLMGIVICFTIYSIALVLSALATPGEAARGLTFRERLALAHSNMQANLSFSDLRITMEMDFYTALLRTGFGAITMASEAVYLNEDRGVNLKRMTWLEEERYREFEELRLNWMSAGVPGSHYDATGVIGLVPVKEDQIRATSGYARERAAQKLTKSRAGESRVMRDGVGAAERSGRWLMALDYLMHINKLVVTTWAMTTCKVLKGVGIQNPPVWLKNWSRLPKAGRPEKKGLRRDRPYESVIVSQGSIGLAEIHRTDRVDVEHELRRTYNEKANWPDETARERWLDNRLYLWWLHGGWWGKKDSSGEYKPSTEEQDPDWDNTSVITTTESEPSGSDSEGGWEDDEDEDDGQRTPTQRSPFTSRESTPVFDNPLQPSDLAALLHPRSAEERDQARALAAHLGSDRIMTRSSYRRLEQVQRSHVLFPNQHVRAVTKMTPDEEAELLEQVLLERRAATAAPADGGGASASASASAAAAAGSWATGAAGMGPDGPQCVVCQSSPRTIIVWPCRCLSLCDDCRVSLAMNNFDKCVCCRREVISFSRIYVP
ncbi:hypothetical protein VMCG_02312 [Cytospora schulzeri]|uniref:RING-type domain-containing protein n=1 Tax=Cytospora schulzeri TaxID=448051 RepID=A0A423X1Q9_9PEZI|nr:hypothetical protein VMCG_02312 [Valsa malicola]